MSLGLVYSVIKDLAKLARLEDGEDIDVGRMSIEELRAAGFKGLENGDDAFHWIAPRNLLEKTNKAGGSYDIVYVNQNRKRSRLVRKNSSGQVDLVLC